MERRKRLMPRGALFGALAVTAALALAPGASAKTEKLTGKATTAKNQGERGVHVVIALRRGHKSAGRLTFPGCAGTGFSVICGGTLNLTGAGSGLSVLFTWGCHLKHGGGEACANSATSTISDSAGANLGSITLKIGPPGIGGPLQKGKSFQVKVKPV